MHCQHPWIELYSIYECQNKAYYYYIYNIIIYYIIITSKWE